MTSTLRALTVAAASAALLFSLAACAAPAATDATATPTDAAATLTTDGACEGASGVTVVVDASALEGADDASGTWCVAADETVGAADVLLSAGVETEGTEEYGDQVVCRVDGIPAADEALTAEDGSDYFETCEAMPAAFAYWSLWVQTAGGEWGYAQEGLSTLQVEPGDAVELLFTLNGEPAAPAPLAS